MFDFLKRGSAPSQKQIEKLVKRLTEPGGENAPRIEAAEKLAEWGTAESLYALLKRFTISSNVITQDIEEKRMVVRMLAEKGNDAVEPILRFLSSHHNVEWPVQALSEILPHQELVPKLVEILEKVAAASDFTPPEHKADLIRAMRGHVTPEIANVLRQFLTDDDDDVRISAIEAIPEAGEQVRELLRYLSSELNRLYFQYWNVAQLAIGVVALWFVIKLPAATRPKWGILGMLAIALFLTALITPFIVSVGRSIDFVPRDPPPANLRTFGLLHVTYTVFDGIQLILGIFVTVWLVKAKD